MAHEEISKSDAFNKGNGVEPTPPSLNREIRVGFHPGFLQNGPWFLLLKYYGDASKEEHGAQGLHRRRHRRYTRQSFRLAPNTPKDHTEGNRNNLLLLKNLMGEALSVAQRIGLVGTRPTVAPPSTAPRHQLAANDDLEALRGRALVVTASVRAFGRLRGSTSRTLAALFLASATLHAATKHLVAVACEMEMEGGGGSGSPARWRLKGA